MINKSSKPKFTTFAGLTMSESGWARFLGISNTAFRYRQKHWAPDRVYVLGRQESGTREYTARKRETQKRSDSRSVHCEF